MVRVLPVELRGAVVRRRGRAILGPVDLTLAGEGLTCVLGPNGAGKTTLLRVMHGIERLSGGTVGYGLPEREALRRQGFVFQAPIVLRRTVAENLAYPLRLAGAGRADAARACADWGGRIGLGAVLDQPAQRLSGGEKQMLALGRALISGPDLLFLDEPCASLDGRATAAIEGLLRAARESRTRIIMATHDLAQARRLADEVIFLRNGQVERHCAAEAFFAAPQSAAEEAFLKGDILQ
ncbi:ATP-binding cassette domain-containing protein [Alphaproteobacteria bacterium KMM 3653]|uniref:ATP-binding cassette domain-containing protein n=1 Tax=Harenicola maris TaxID=2841044 RepID=A0AAP2G8V9_9RHOB|nr:ATP-binding cassette domain-containing protein [Harenicola maris]